MPILRETPPTGISDSVLKRIAETFSADPPIKVHPGIKRILKVRVIAVPKMVKYSEDECQIISSLYLKIHK